MRSRREKVFGPGRAVPLDRNAKCRLSAYVRAWDRQHRLPGTYRPLDDRLRGIAEVASVEFRVALSDHHLL
jgi:hypothetical protein